MGNAALFRTAQPIFCLKNIDNLNLKRVIFTGLKEKYTGNLTRNEILKDKIINLLVEEACVTNLIACEIAVKKLGAIGNILYQPMLFCRKDRSFLNVARIVGSQSDLVLLSSASFFCLKKLGELVTKPTINILNCAQCPALSFAAMMTIFEHYKRFENLNVALIGRPYPYFNSLLLLLPRLDVNTKVLTALSKNTRVSPRYFAVAQEFATRAGKEIKECKNLEDALRGSDVIMISQNIWNGFSLYEKDITQLCNKDWSIFHDPFDGSLFESDILEHNNSLSFKMIENLRWAYFTILLEIFRVASPETADKITEICEEECVRTPESNEKNDIADAKNHFKT